jgi:hypothetical protein
MQAAWTRESGKTADSPPFSSHQQTQELVPGHEEHACFNTGLPCSQHPIGDERFVSSLLEQPGAPHHQEDQAATMTLLSRVGRNLPSLDSLVLEPCFSYRFMVISISFFQPSI